MGPNENQAKMITHSLRIEKKKKLQILTMSPAFQGSWCVSECNSETPQAAHVVKSVSHITVRNYLRPHQVADAASSAEPPARQSSCFTAPVLCFQPLIVSQRKVVYGRRTEGAALLSAPENISLSFGLLLALFKVKSVPARAFLGCILTITDLYLSSLMESQVV